MYVVILSFLALLFCSACQNTECAFGQKTLLISPSTSDEISKDNFTGRARIVGPRTLVIQNLVFSLSGVDAPVPGSGAGDSAERAMARLVEEQVVTCTPMVKVLSDAMVARCFVGTLDLGSALVASGKALACQNRLGAKYTYLETEDALESLPRSDLC
jgi:hypothetical protein